MLGRGYDDREGLDLVQAWGVDPIQGLQERVEAVHYLCEIWFLDLKPNSVAQRPDLVLGQVFHVSQ